MSTYPTLILPIGVSWKYKKTAKFNTIRQDTQSGKRPAMATLQYGVNYEFTLNWSYLKQKGVTTSNDLRYIQEFYEAMRGSYGLFIFDPTTRHLEDLACVQDTTQMSNGGSGKTDGTSLSYPLWRSTNIFGGGIYTLCERIQNVTGLYGLTVGGVNQAWGSFSQSNFPATVTFQSPPAANQDIVWWGTYNYICQFSEDTQDFDEFLYQLWSLDSLKLEAIQL